MSPLLNGGFEWQVFASRVSDVCQQDNSIQDRDSKQCDETNSRGNVEWHSSYKQR